MSNNEFVYYLQTEKQHYLLQKGHNPIGRDRRVCKIHLSEKFLGRTHVNIVTEQNQCYMQVFAKHLVRLNNRRITIHSDAAVVNIDLEDGDTITIHNYVFKLVKYIVTDSDLDDTDIE